MIQGAVAKYALSKVLEYLFNKSKRFKAILDYVHEENDADKRISDLESEHSVTKARLDHVILELRKKK